MNLGDVRRLATVTLVVAGAILAWLVFLVLADQELFVWNAPETALGWLDITGWLWVCLGMLVLFLFIMSMIVFGAQQAPSDFTKGSVRQVQCQNCKAVFFIYDTGHRPITHRCPSCKFLGVYDGKAPAVGEAPKAEPPKQLVKLDITCHSCDHDFKVTDTGVRPLKLKCPNCQATGKLS